MAGKDTHAETGDLDRGAGFLGVRSFLRHFQSLLKREAPEETDFAEHLRNRGDGVLDLYRRFQVASGIVLMIALITIIPLLGAGLVDMGLAQYPSFVNSVETNSTLHELGRIYIEDLPGFIRTYNIWAVIALVLVALVFRIVLRKRYYHLRAERNEHIKSIIKNRKHSIYKDGSEAFTKIDAYPDGGLPRHEQGADTFKKGWDAAQRLDAVEFIAYTEFFRIARVAAVCRTGQFIISLILMGLSLGILISMYKVEGRTSLIIIVIMILYFISWIFLMSQKPNLEVPDVEDEGGACTSDRLGELAADAVSSLIWKHDQRGTVNSGS